MIALDCVLYGYTYPLQNTFSDSRLWLYPNYFVQEVTSYFLSWLFRAPINSRIFIEKSKKTRIKRCSTARLKLLMKWRNIHCQIHDVIKEINSLFELLLFFQVVYVMVRFMNTSHRTIYNINHNMGEYVVHALSFTECIVYIYSIIFAADKVQEQVNLPSSPLVRKIFYDGPFFRARLFWCAVPSNHLKTNSRYQL